MYRPAWRAQVLVLLGLLLACSALAPKAEALVRLDFEQRFYQHPGQQVWDFSIVRPDSIYHIFYHSIAEATPNAANADTIWHATSRDLKHWEAPEAAITVGQGPWDAGAIWAPDVFWDEGNTRWVMAYTGCDAGMNQSICLAYSANLRSWNKALANPVVSADTSLYVWDANGTWSDFRDPFIYRQGDQWQLLLTAKLQALGGNKGVIYHATSDNLTTWTDVGPFFVNDGPTPGKVLESCQYRMIGSTAYLMFGEFDTYGPTLLAAADPSGWTMVDQGLFEIGGYAPEVDEFDPGVYVYSRLTPFSRPSGGQDLSYVVRLDTLLTDPDGSNLRQQIRHPLDDNWIVHSGTTNLANPTFGDNPVYRGEPSVGMVGNSYYSSQEYYQGPQSGRGSPGTKLGDSITGLCESYRFPITGNRMTLLVGGGDYPTTCYVALVDAATDEILFRETGTGSDPMTLRTWDLAPYQGRMCYVTIVDSEYGVMGHINVDEIIESSTVTVAGGVELPVRPLQHSAWPNPFNPRTTISFTLAEPARCEVRVHDMRGHLVWRSSSFGGRVGANAVVWTGNDSAGAAVAAGTYLYAISVDGTVRASDKISLVK